MNQIAPTREWVKQTLPKRKKESHKGTFGTLHILAGSQPYRGAAVLCSSAALRAGAGLVRLVSIEAVCAAAAATLPCCILQPVPAGVAGGIGVGGAEAALTGKATAMLAGCGMGAHAETALIVETLLQNAECPLVLDADALNVLAGRMETGNSERRRQRMLHLLKHRKHPTVLTPHVGEMARLAGAETAGVAKDQAGFAKGFAAEYGCVVVCKSGATATAEPGGEVFYSDSVGNPGLATGGSGDVLAGIIASLAAQGVKPFHAAACGVWLHGAAADLAAESTGYAGLSPADLPLALARLLQSIGQ